MCPRSCKCCPNRTDTAPFLRRRKLGRAGVSGSRNTWAGLLRGREEARGVRNSPSLRAYMLRGCQTTDFSSQSPPEQTAHRSLNEDSIGHRATSCPETQPSSSNHGVARGGGTWVPDAYFVKVDAPRVATIRAAVVELTCRPRGGGGIVISSTSAAYACPARSIRNNKSVLSAANSRRSCATSDRCSES
jgi:hypothetical protein